MSVRYCYTYSYSYTLYLDTYRQLVNGSRQLVIYTLPEPRDTLHFVPLNRRRDGGGSLVCIQHRTIRTDLTSRTSLSLSLKRGLSQLPPRNC